MNLKPSGYSVSIQKEILHTTQGLIYKVGGLTLDGTAFAKGVVEAGTAVTVEEGQLAVPFTAAGEGETINGVVYVTSHDQLIDESDNPIVGAYEEAYFNKNRVDFPEGFLEAAEGRYKVR